ncbi:MAG: hypothetical protein GY708_14315, partial [Actinomycetia bacterium]|nr:hypothetical protein [Actinomycetes bacterium]
MREPAGALARHSDMKIMRTLILVVVVTLLATACGTDSRVASPTGDDEHDVPTTGDGATTVPDESGRGWLDDGDWVRSAGDAAFGAEEDGASRVETEMLAEPSDGDDVATTPGLEPPIDDSPLQAGSIDDGADVSAYLEYRDLILGRGVQVRSLEVTESTLIEVLGENGLPVLDALVEVWDPHTDATDPIVSLRTTADGTVRFLPATVAADSLDLFDLVVTANGVNESVSIERGEDSVTVTLPVAGGVDGAVPLDIHFVLDATGSMGDEIDRLRDNMSSIAEQ